MGLMKKRELIESSIKKGIEFLSEYDGYKLLEGFSLRIPKAEFISNSTVSNFSGSNLNTERVVIKIVSPLIQHKSEHGGVAIVPNQTEEIKKAIDRMISGLGKITWDGVAIFECIEFDRSLGHEYLLGFRITPDFGPVVILGPGGIHTEYISETFQSRNILSVFSRTIHQNVEEIVTELQQNTFLPLVTGGLRSQKKELDVMQVAELIHELLQSGDHLVDSGLQELEINPLVVSDGELVALDVLTKLGEKSVQNSQPRPLHKIGNLLKPESIGIIGVSEKMNPGRIILKNTLQCGFNPQNICIIKSGVDQIDGCQCVDRIPDMSEKVDLMVLCVSAGQVPELISEIIEHQKAESIILIPGGLEEKTGSEQIVAEMKEKLVASRSKKWQGPVINGGNCVGVRSFPGQYDTLFIPQHKIAASGNKPSPIAVISQSGAYLVALLDRLTEVSPSYAISIGNQTDLTIADYVTFLKDDPDIEIFGIYCEGLKPGDGARLLKLAIELRAAGKRIVFYHGGKTLEGVAATASHTASVAGDYTVFRGLATQCGVLLTESLNDFEDLMSMSYFLNQKPVKNLNCGALSNAGFECVAVADNLGPFTLSDLSSGTTDVLKSILKKARISEIVDINNPLDLTPMMNDQAYIDAIKAVLHDPSVGIGVFGIVPLTPALNSLEAGPGHKEDILSEQSIVQMLIKLKHESSKPWIVVVDGGQKYQAMVDALKKEQIPVFTKMDRAMRLFGLYCSLVYGAK